MIFFEIFRYCTNWNFLAQIWKLSTFFFQSSFFAQSSLRQKKMGRRSAVTKIFANSIFPKIWNVFKKSALDNYNPRRLFGARAEDSTWAAYLFDWNERHIHIQSLWNVFAPFGKFRQNITKCQDKNFQRGFSKLSGQLYPILSQKWPKNGFSTSFLGGGPKKFLPGEALSGREKTKTNIHLSQ